ncbi:DNA relaxase MbeA [Roseovarius gaetbuli]|uniref:DNA relaxase MbeA n=1 Tax=Roseovarius gaetbuli TaxID=1356575 RepID=A0A1X7A6D2_9RHOB|nr:relaxase/mobilization nuclease domain-containing protein [Roseovarius gaetbuli]SLN71740.1 DNA relaxase MbeA [Roseovarius gaetbuli]
MLIKFFRNGKGAGAGPVGYLVADKVLAYDDNRDLIRDADGQPMAVTREPLPEVLRGNPDRTEALIDASRHQWTYRAGVISFAATDAPTEEQQAEVMDGFERLAFAGLDPTQYEVLWVRHTHEDRVELHFCTPRLELRPKERCRRRHCNSSLRLSRASNLKARLKRCWRRKWRRFISARWTHRGGIFRPRLWLARTAQNGP